jgi:hypothetical protein
MASPLPRIAITCALCLGAGASPAAANGLLAEPTAAPAIERPATVVSAGAKARILADGTASIPRSAPASVRRVIAVANAIAGLPYKWGGGHGVLEDTGYDCSGAVGYGLIKAGLLSGPMTSGMLAGWGEAGAGEWISVYANAEHAYLEVAGLRLDTSRVGDPSGLMGVRWRPAIGQRLGFAARHPATQ